MMIYTVHEIADICGGTVSGNREVTVTSVSMDSRNNLYGGGVLFAAVSGVNHDGHDYIGEMYRRGVRAFMVERIPEGSFPEAGFVICGNTIEALQSLAAHYRNGFKGIVVGITGSNGKTITKEWLAQLAPPEIKIFRSPRSYNSQTGTALSLLMAEGNEDMVFIEAGISKPGEMARLEKMIRPDIGILTGIGDAHQENFATIDQKLNEKLLLFVNSRKVIAPESVKSSVSGKLTAELFFTSPDCFDLGAFPFTDTASRENIALVLKFFEVMGCDPKAVSSRLPYVQRVAMRLETKTGIAGSTIINDSYNCDVNSLGTALDYLNKNAGERPKYVILSDISQSAGDKKTLYDKVAAMVKTHRIDRFIGIGKDITGHADLFGDNSEFYRDTDQFLKYFHRNRVRDSVVLIKGGRAFGFEKISHALEMQTHTTVLEIDLDKMIYNLNYFRSKLKSGTKIMAMIKAFGYGSGAAEVAAMLQNQRVDYLAVAFADEGVALRNAGITMPIVVLNADPDSFGQMAENNLEPEIYSFTSLDAFHATVLKYGFNSYPIHIKLDTGMHRLGFTEDEISGFINKLRAYANLSVKSVFSHLAASDEDIHSDFTREQIERFRKASGTIAEAFPSTDIIRHISNTAAIERYPEANFNMVRLGIGLYGIGTPGQDLQPVSTFKSRIVQIKNIPAGETIGYGRRGTAKTDITLATVPVGYADGLDRRLSCGRWSMLVKGKPAPIMGNICMDTCMIDITGIDAAEGDEVIIFGPREVSVAKMAEELETIPYEILTGISARVKRIYIKE